MIAKTVIRGLVLAAAVFAAGDAFAQKYPERRMARDGNRAYGRGDFEGAETEYRRALETNPELREALFNLGNAAFRQEKGEEAAKIYMGIATDSLAAPAMLSAANYNLGNTMLAGQQLEDAIEFYKQALRIDPTDMEAKYNLAYAKKMLQNQPPEDQNQDQDQDQDQNQDKNQDNEDNQDQSDNQSDQNEDQNEDRNQDQDDQNGEGDDQDQQQDQGDPPQSDQQSGENEASIDPQDAEHMLDAMQDEEDKTRDKMNAKEVQAVGRSGKNW